MLHLCLVIGLVVAAAYDILFLRIPNVLLVVLVGIWLLLSATDGLQPQNTLLPALVVFASLIALRSSLDRRRSESSIGDGDVKLIAVMALYIGWLVLPAVFVASATALLFILFRELSARAARRQVVASEQVNEAGSVFTAKVPFAPFLLIGACVSLFGQVLFWNLLGRIVA